MIKYPRQYSHKSTQIQCQSLKWELKSLFNHQFPHISVYELNAEKINPFFLTMIFLKIFFLFDLV